MSIAPMDKQRKSLPQGRSLLNFLCRQTHIILKMYLVGGLGPSREMVGSLLIPNGRQSWPAK
jgi:hypothetical protein